MTSTQILTLTVAAISLGVLYLWMKWAQMAIRNLQLHQKLSDEIQDRLIERIKRLEQGGQA